MLPTLAVWLAHFEYHAGHRPHAPGDHGSHRCGGPCAALARSLLLFQCEEPPAHLIECARTSGADSASTLVRVLQLLLAEEQRHARLLQALAQSGALDSSAKAPAGGVVLASGGVVLASGGVVSASCGVLRRIGGFELGLTVLAMAELIGSVYYRRLAQWTRCAPLRALCREVLADELAHIGLESELLAALRASRSARARALTSGAERLLLTALALLVWLARRPLLRAAGWHWGSFHAACRAQYEFHLGAAPAGAPGWGSAGREELRADVAKGFELEHVAGRIVQKHRRLLAR